MLLGIREENWSSFVVLFKTLAPEFFWSKFIYSGKH